jgi:hypothetical protein
MISKSVLVSSSLAAIFTLAALAACGNAPPSEATGKSGQAATVDPQFTACATVPQAGCCHNGWLAAVSVDSVTDYASANACTVAPLACPLYVVNDTRVAVCDTTANACTLVQPTASSPVTKDDAGADDAVPADREDAATPSN